VNSLEGIKMAKSKNLKVTLTRSMIGRLKSHKACISGLGLRRVGHTVVIEDTAAVRGMINKARYMLRVEVD
jgi:large subunit ribosomal protein L30